MALRLTVPYLNVRAPEGTIITGPGGEPIPGEGPMTTNSGIGDVIAGITLYDVLSNRRLGFAMDLSAKVKLGTADETKGLGTGENDYTVQANFLKFLDKITLIDQSDTSSAVTRWASIWTTSCWYPLAVPISSPKGPRAACFSTIANLQLLAAIQGKN